MESLTCRLLPAGVDATFAQRMTTAAQPACLLDLWSPSAFGSAGLVFDQRFSGFFCGSGAPILVAELEGSLTGVRRPACYKPLEPWQTVVLDELPLSSRAAGDDLEDVEHVVADPWTSPQADPWNQHQGESNNASQPASGMTAPAATPSCVPGMSLGAGAHGVPPGFLSSGGVPGSSMASWSITRHATRSIRTRPIGHAHPNLPHVPGGCVGAGHPWLGTGCGCNFPPIPPWWCSMTSPWMPAVGPSTW